MDKQEFMKQQYISLREEVKETKARIFKTLGFGLIVVPAANFLANSYEVGVLIVLMPLLPVVVAFIYLSENRAKVRCGRYIRLHIEEKVEGIKPGWETCLEDPDRYDRRNYGEYDTRCVDKYLDWSCYALFFIYFASSVCLGAQFLWKSHENGMFFASVFVCFYMCVFIFFLYFLITHIEFSTATKKERDKKNNAQIQKKHRTTNSERLKSADK